MDRFFLYGGVISKRFGGAFGVFSRLSHLVVPIIPIGAPNFVRFVYKLFEFFRFFLKTDTAKDNLNEAWPDLVVPWLWPRVPNGIVWASLITGKERRASLQTPFTERSLAACPFCWPGLTLCCSVRHRNFELLKLIKWRVRVAKYFVVWSHCGKRSRRFLSRWRSKCFVLKIKSQFSSSYFCCYHKKNFRKKNSFFLFFHISFSCHSVAFFFPNQKMNS